MSEECEDSEDPEHEKQTIWSPSVGTSARTLVSFTVVKDCKRAQPPGKDHWLTRETQLFFATWSVCLSCHSSSALREMETQGKKLVMLSFFNYPHKCWGTEVWLTKDER